MEPAPSVRMTTTRERAHIALQMEHRDTATREVVDLFTLNVYSKPNQNGLLSPSRQIKHHGDGSRLIKNTNPHWSFMDINRLYWIFLVSLNKSQIQPITIDQKGIKTSASFISI